MARIRDLVKTYKLINDPDAPQWNVKFLGAVAVIAAAAVALSFWGGSSPDAPAAGAGVASTQDGGGGGGGAGAADPAPSGATVDPGNVTLPAPTLGLPP